MLNILVRIVATFRDPVPKAVMAEEDLDTGGREQKRSKKNRKKISSKALATEHLQFEEDSVDAESFPEGLEETLSWYEVGPDSKSQTLEVLRLEVLSPFLFSKQLLSDKAVTMCRDRNLLPESGVLPAMFDRTCWSDVLTLVKVMAAIHTACSSDDELYQEILNGTSTLSKVEVVQHLHARDQLCNMSSSEIESFYEVIATQGLDLSSRMKKRDDLAAHFLKSLREKAKFADAIKVRANSNFKLKNLKAAIADYNKAISFCCYNSVLYYNRAICFLLSEDYWSAALDSFRSLFLSPKWEKPYWRCADVWHKLGDVSVAKEINHQRQLLATNDLYLSPQLNSFTGTKEKRSPSITSASVTTEKLSSSLCESTTQSSPRTTKRKASKEVSSSGDHDNKKLEAPLIQGDQDMKQNKESPALAEGDKKGKNAEPCKPYTELEDLQCPELHPRLTCSELRRLCHQVQLDWCSPAAYFSAAGSKWETLEPEWAEPDSPTTDPSSEREPMLAKFDEIWCPVLADSEDSSSIIPPTFQYFSDGTIMHATAY